MRIPEIHIREYNYHLPDDKIAKYPLAQRDLSKLLIFKDQQISSTSFPSIVDYIPANSLILFNNTKVIQARLPFTKATGAAIEIFCLEPHSPNDAALSFSQTNEVTWKCIVGNLRKWKSEPLCKEVNINNESTTIEAHKGNVSGDALLITFKWNNANVTFAEVIEQIGITPIPPYLNRQTEEIDKERYQTVYSIQKGSVAAPTAGLHFTPQILDALKKRSIQQEYVTLHVGAGTFKPVKSETIDEHEMHIEHFNVEKCVIEALLKNANHITAVGTTTVRTIESLYWLGVKLLEKSDEFCVNQWDPYNLPSNYSVKDALEAILDYLNQRNTNLLTSHTGIIIVPGYEFKLIQIMVTNFHQPQSTLLLLVSAFIGGENRKQIYEYALENDYRFLSYGDSSILFGK